ncbi:unnamed protein product [Rhizoctonia solani]|uniref:Protein kinase domain-containing protein n=1 Tax=Rhizoctonia solani TaxID=456999 RepID=A0A8H2XWS8_9AGAM|nr:unnamed protein product [Rhizoctonia solani]
MSSASKPAYGFGREPWQRTVAMAAGVDPRGVRDDSPVRSLPSGLTPLQKSLQLERSQRYGLSLAPFANKLTPRSAQERARKPTIPNKLVIPPIYTNVGSSDTDTSFQEGEPHSNPYGYTSALTSPTNSDFNQQSDGEEGRITHIKTKAHKLGSFDLSPQLDMESRRLEAVWRETGERWKDKHGIALPRSQHAAFRQRIESGTDIKSDSPIDKEWRDIWLHTNTSWSDAESAYFESPSISSASASNAGTHNSRLFLSPSTIIHAVPQAGYQNTFFPIPEQIPELEREPAVFRRIEKLIDTIEGDEGPGAFSSLLPAPVEQGYQRGQEKNAKIKGRKQLRAGIVPQDGQRVTEFDLKPEPSMASPEDHPIAPAEQSSRKRHRADKQKLREKQRAEEARRCEAAEHRGHDHGVRYERQKQSYKNQEQKHRLTNDSSLTEVPPLRHHSRVASLDNWNSYEMRWSALSASGVTHSINFRDIPWPLLRVPAGPKSITTQSVGAFILSPSHSHSRSREERLLNAMLRWEPKSFEGRWMSRIEEGERHGVREAVGEIYASLVQLMNGNDSSNSKIVPTVILAPQAPKQDTVTIGKRMSAHDIIRHLVERGCQDLTESLDMSTFSEYPTSHGGFSDVYRGSLIAGEHIAVKALRISTGSIENPKHLKRAARELYTWSNCKHPNVLRLLGLAVFRGRIGMVSPWIDHGPLPRYLSSNSEVDRCNLCAQICDGLSYLHNTGIVHGDLKGANVLVLKDGTPVLIDFGNSTFLGLSLLFTETTREGSMTGRWAAPELLEGSGKPSKVADIYALGMTMLEVITGKLPYDGKGDLAVFKLVSHKKHPERPEEHIPTGSRDGNKIWRLLKKCWAYEPAKRPSAAKATTVMRSITPQGLKAISTL